LFDGDGGIAIDEVLTDGGGIRRGDEKLAPGHNVLGTRLLPRGALVRYREDYIASGPGKGLKLTAEQVADRIIEREKDDPRLAYAVLDPSTFKEDGGPSIAERINGKLVKAKLPAFRKADNSRVTKIAGHGSGPMSGWDIMRQRMIGTGTADDPHPTIFWFSTCLDSIRTIPALQHDSARPEDLDCWIAGTQISTPFGNVLIENVCPGCLVDTPIGPRKVLKSYLSGAGSTCWVQLSNGLRLEGTPHHKIYVKGKGLVALEALVCHDMPIERNMSWQRRLLYIAASLTHGMKAGFTTIQTALSWNVELPVFIAKFGLMLAGKFHLAGISTTLITTTTTMNSATSNVFRREIMDGCISKNVCLAISEKLLLNGVQARKGNRYYERMLRKCGNECRDIDLRAEIVASLLKLDILERCIVQLHAQMLRVASNLKKIARYVGLNFGLAKATRKKFAPVHIVAVGRCDAATKVYNLTVADAHLFYANGVLSSNTNSEDHCADDTRYACISRPWLKTNLAPEPVKDAYRPPGEEIPSSNFKVL
jgi:hypothetical protein